MANFGNEVNEFYLEQIRRSAAERRKRISGISTAEEARSYVAEVRGKIRRILALPWEKSPLDVHSVDTLDCGGYSVEKLFYFSRPDYPVTANFYLPRKRDGKVPAVLFVCGHAPDGKACDSYQRCCIGLARKGFAVLCLDPVAQGERRQSQERFNTQEHNMLGKQLILCGDFFGSWRVWDAVRGIDYLLTRPEIDPERIGLTGNSGGGTLATLVHAVEDRLCMTAVDCYMTSWRRNVENEEAADFEQIPPGAVARGLEMGDFLLASAPRPVLINSQRNDFFDPRGASETFGECKRIYDLLGGNIRFFVGPGNHGYGPENRESMFGFFTETIFGAADAKEPEIDVLPEYRLYAAPGGEVSNLPGGKKVADFIREKARELRKKRPEGRTLAELRPVVAESLRLGVVEAPYYRALKPGYRPGFPGFLPVSRFGLETEPGRVMALLKVLSRSGYYHLPIGNRKKIVLHVAHLNSDEFLPLLEREDTLFTLELRGTGETTPDGCSQMLYRGFFEQYHVDYHFAALALLLDRPYLEGRVRDLLDAVELLSGEGAEIEVEAHGISTVPALLAAVLSEKIGALRLFGAPDSWESMATETGTMWPLSVMIPGILERTDLPELEAALGARVRRVAP